MKNPPCVLTIAGSDSGAGAGIQADVRTIHALGGFACTAITAVTAQNTRGVQAWEPVASKLIEAQVRAVLSDLPVAAIKTGLLPGAAGVRAVCRALEGADQIPLVIDPILGSTSGTLFLAAADLKVLKRDLFSRATLITPNWPEAQALTGRRVRNGADAEAAANEIADRAGCAVLLKGGHGPGAECRDCLVMADGEVRWFEAHRIATKNTHGTGCVLSAAIATGLALGKSLVDSVEIGHAFLQASLRLGRRRKWGGGAGPAFAGR
jgi:hydroxymethylpyrimidine/phosphomethylpyrimidine kinase